MDKVTRKELKTDHFAIEVQQGFEYVTEHRNQLIRWGGIAIAVVVVLAAIQLYRSHERTVRDALLTSAMQIQNTTVGAPAGSGQPSFPTQQAKDAASTKAFSEIVAKYPGTDEAAVAENYLGDIFADKGDLAAAEKYYKMAIDSGKAAYASQAKLSLAQVYQAEGKLKDAESLVRSVMDHPTVLVSKDEATIILAQLIAPSNPQEARKLLEPLRASDRAAISRAAVTAMGSIPQK